MLDSHPQNHMEGHAYHFGFILGRLFGGFPAFRWWRGRSPLQKLAIWLVLIWGMILFLAAGNQPSNPNSLATAPSITTQSTTSEAKEMNEGVPRDGEPFVRENDKNGKSLQAESTEKNPSRRIEQISIGNLMILVGRYYQATRRTLNPFIRKKW